MNSKSFATKKNGMLALIIHVISNILQNTRLSNLSIVLMED